MENKKQPMNIENALSRISWRFKNQNIKIGESKIVINQTDVDAVNFLAEWINNQKQETINYNALFAKLYAYCLFHEIEFYKDAKFANTKLQEQLKLPIIIHYDKIAERLKMLNIEREMNNLGIETDHGKDFIIHKSKSKESEKNNQQELLKQNQKRLSELLTADNSESVYKALNNQITECINKYKNLP